MARLHWTGHTDDPLATLPTELPEFVTPFASSWHRLQIEWLIDSVNARWSGRNDFHCDGHTPVYYAARPDRTAIAVVPDFYAAVGCERKERKCWATWNEEGRRPDVMIEIIDEHLDRGVLKEKVNLYEEVFRMPEYFLFHPRSGEVVGFSFNIPYARLKANPVGRIWSETLEAWVGPWAGHHRGTAATWLRLFDSPNP